jgi:hypothetical protein
MKNKAPVYGKIGPKRNAANLNRYTVKKKTHEIIGFCF